MARKHRFVVGPPIQELPGSPGPALTARGLPPTGGALTLEGFFVNRTLATAAILALTASLAACGGGGGAPSAPTTGQLNLKIGDAPVDGASHVYIVFTGVELQSASGARVNIDFPQKEIDVLAYQNGATAELLRGEEVPAGDYNWMRLKVIAVKNQNDGSRIVFPDTAYPLYIPSGAETGLKLNRPFRVAAGGVTRMVADFDLRKSILKPKGQDPNYVLKPVLRLMDEMQTGTLDGIVNLRTMTDEQLGTVAGTNGPEPRPITDCKAGVYVFEWTAEGQAATPDDADGDGVNDGGSDPLLYFPVTWDGVNDTVSFTVAYLATGHYTVAATCNYDADVSPDTNEYWPDPGLDSGTPPANEAIYDTMKWSTVDDVVISANQTTSVALQPAP
jgi:hypothetical protein